MVGAHLLAKQQTLIQWQCSKDLCSSYISLFFNSKNQFFLIQKKITSSKRQRSFSQGILFGRTTRDLMKLSLFLVVLQVPMFEKMDKQLLDALCDRLKPALFTDKSFIIREGDPVEEMHFLMRGTLLTMTINGGRTGFFNSVHLKAGDFCGDELLTWALDPHTSSSSLPISTRTVQAVTDIEAFALTADDLKFVTSQFRRLHSKQLQHTFKFFSQQWRTWAACFIQVAWRRHCRNKLKKSLREEEDKLQATLAKESTSASSLGAAIYASKFAANVLCALRRNNTTGTESSPTLPRLLHKPAEPDFSEKR